MTTQERAAARAETEDAATEMTAALEDLMREHIPLVGHVVRDAMARVPSHVSRDDLTSAGLAALVAAARAYDAGRGVPFAVYAATRIRGAVTDELRATDWASRSVRRRAREVETTRAELGASLGRVPTDAEVAQALGLTEDEVRRNAEDVQRAGVLSLHGFGETPWEEIVTTTVPSPEAVAEKRELASYLADAVAELPERLRIVVEGYFFAERPMAEIAAELGVTDSRISQMRAEALVLLRGALDHAFAPDGPTAGQPQGVVARRRAAYFAAVQARAAAGRHGGGPVISSA